jgi:hypothetical protein
MDDSNHTKKRKREGSPDGDQKQKKKKAKVERVPKTKKSEAEIRNARLAKGALLLQFNVERDGLGQKSIDRWRSVEKKGFFVTTKGCLIPAECHLFSNRSKKVGYDCALEFFRGQIRNPETAGNVNVHGWDCEETVSHLCHRNSCCAHSHLELVERWKNLKRDYCGYNGLCDCGSVPMCLDTYHPASFVRDDEFLTYKTPGLAKKIKEFFEITDNDIKVKVKILQIDHYTKDDKKKENKNKRISGSKKTVKETKKKAIRLNK